MRVQGNRSVPKLISPFLYSLRMFLLNPLLLFWVPLLFHEIPHVLIMLMLMIMTTRSTPRSIHTYIQAECICMLHASGLKSPMFCCVSFSIPSLRWRGFCCELFGIKRKRRHVRLEFTPLKVNSMSKKNPDSHSVLPIQPPTTPQRSRLILNIK